MRNSTRQKVISNRRCLKGTGIEVHEVLTKVFQYIFDAARNMSKSVDNVKSVCTWNGITYVLAEDKDKIYQYKVRSSQDIQAVAKKHSNTCQEVKSTQGTPTLGYIRGGCYKWQFIRIELYCYLLCFLLFKFVNELNAHCIKLMALLHVVVVLDVCYIGPT